MSTLVSAANVARGAGRIGRRRSIQHAPGKAAAGEEARNTLPLFPPSLACLAGDLTRVPAVAERAHQVPAMAASRSWPFCRELGCVGAPGRDSSGQRRRSLPHRRAASRLASPRHGDTRWQPTPAQHPSSQHGCLPRQSACADANKRRARVSAIRAPEEDATPARRRRAVPVACTSVC